MTPITPIDMDPHKDAIDGPVITPWGNRAPTPNMSTRRAYRDALEQRVINLHARPDHVQSLIVAQTAEPIRHRRASRWERISRSPWFLPVVVVTYPTLIIVLGILAVRWIEYVQGGAL